MFSSISKSNPWFIVQNLSLTVAVVLGTSLDAQAENTKTYETLQVSCNPFTTDTTHTQCNSDLLVKPEAETIAQRRGRRRKSKVEGYYAGGTLGIFFPSDLDDLLETNNAFGGSAFGGVKFSKYFSTDIEVFGALGDFEDLEVTDSNNIELDYSGFGFYINPKAELPLFDLAGSSATIYLSPGIGLSSTTISVDFGQDLANEAELDFQEVDGTQIGFSFQIKGGAKIPVSSSINLIAQVRYAILPTEDFLVDDSLKVFSTEGGLSFNF